MVGVYTNIAKKRAEQSKNTVSTTVSPSAVIAPIDEKEHTQRMAENPPASPPPVPPAAPKHTLQKKQISAYLTHHQHTIFKQLYHQLNSTDANVDKGEIVGLSLEVLSALLADDVPNFPSLAKLREYVFARVSKT